MNGLFSQNHNEEKRDTVILCVFSPTLSGETMLFEAVAIILHIGDKSQHQISTVVYSYADNHMLCPSPPLDFCENKT